MKVTRDKTENHQAYLTVEMSEADLEAPLEAAFKRLAQKASIPGFRKGKVPRPILERHLGKESILEEAMKQAVPEAYEKAIKEQEITPVDYPDIEITATEPVTFKAVVPLPPDIELGEYKEIRADEPSSEVTDDKIDAVLEELRHQHATWEPVERPAAENDMVVMNVFSDVDEKPFIKRVGVQYQIIKDSVAPAPGFAEQILGMEKGQEKEFTLKLPDDYHQKEMAGKEATFKVKVEEIKEEHLPELNDELAKQVSTEFESLAKLRQEATSGLKQQAEEKARREFEEKIIDALLDISKVEYPPVLLESEIDRIIRDRERQLQGSGQSIDDYLKAVNKTAEEMREELCPVATKNVAMSLALGKLAEIEKIEVSHADIDAEIEKMTGGIPEDKKQEIGGVFNNPNMRESLWRSLMTRKTMDRLMDIARGRVPAETGDKEEKNE